MCGAMAFRRDRKGPGDCLLATGELVKDFGREITKPRVKISMQRMNELLDEIDSTSVQYMALVLSEH